MGSSSRASIVVVLLLAIGASSHGWAQGKSDPKPQPTAAPSGSTQRRPADRCVECHAGATEPALSTPAREHLGSVHRDEVIGCAGCHGGDPEDPTVGGHGASAGFIGRPTREQVPALCGSCHANPRIIRRLNAALPIDQWTLYRGGRHGQLAAAGEPEAPVCTDCHGTHATLPVADPRAAVHRRRVAELCASCHADAKRLAGFQVPTDQYVKWQRSAHADALRRDDPDAPSCTGCHGSHGQLAAEVSSVARVCSTCHEEQLARFRSSPHAKPFRQRGFAECVPCHGTHDVPAAQPLLLSLGPDGSCGTCHTADDQARAITKELAEQVQRATGTASRTRAQIEQLRAAGLPLLQVDPALGELDRSEERLRLVVHTVDPDALAQPVGDVSAVAAAIEQMLAQAGRMRKLERVVYLVVAGLLSVLLVLLVLRVVRLERARET